MYINKQIRNAKVPARSCRICNVKKQNYELSDPRSIFPAELLESEKGVGIYFNPDEGHEIMQEFDDLANGFKKKGINLDEDELDVIRGFISSTVISPLFVKKMVEEYGDDSISVAFLIPNSFSKY